MSNSTVLREKYDTLKKKASQWRDKALKYQKLYQDLLLENNELQNRFFIDPDNSETMRLEEELTELREQHDKLCQTYKETRKKLKDLEFERKQEKLEEKLEDKLIERLSKRVIGLQQHN